MGRRLGEELADFLAGRGIESWPAVAVDSQREWVDHVLLVDCTDPGTVFTAAAVHVQPFLSVWRADPQRQAESLRSWTWPTRWTVGSSPEARPIFGASFCGPAR